MTSIPGPVMISSSFGVETGDRKLEKRVYGLMKFRNSVATAASAHDVDEVMILCGPLRLRW